jgi:hypothetical protein
MSYKKGTNHIFLYHAYALGAGGWVKGKGREYTALPSIAPAVLSITGGYGSSVAHNVDVKVPGRRPFGENGPSDFYMHVGHAFTEVSGIDDYDEDPIGVYKTRVRSVLDDFRINDTIYIEHAEAVLVSTHKKPKADGSVPEATIHVGNSNMSGVHVDGKPVEPIKDPTIDDEPTYGGLSKRIGAYHRQKAEALAVPAGKGGTSPDAWAQALCDRNDLNGPQKGMPDYASDMAAWHTHGHVRLSVFSGLEAPGLDAYHTSIDVRGFGRIFFGEVFASHGTKQVTMVRIDLGCDNCGGVGGGGGSTNGTPP